MYCCPFCGSGTRTHKTGAVKYYPETNTVCCFAGCGKKSYDVIDLCMKYNEDHGSPCDYNSVLSDLAKIIGISIDRQDQAGEDSRPVEQLSFTGEVLSETAEKAAESPQNRAETSKQTNTRPSPQNAPQSRTAAPAAKSGKADATQKQDFTEYYAKCQARLTDPRAAAYLSGRRISLETARRCSLGFDPEADPAGKGYKWPRIIIPTCESQYIGRAIQETAEGGKYDKLNSNGESPALFNGQALKDAKPGDVVFVVEGPFDALSVIEAGGQAVALCSAANAKKFIVDPLKNRPSEAILAICGDADKAGEGAVKTITEGLKNTEQLFAVIDVNSGEKDASDALQADREKFIRDVTNAKEIARLKARKLDNVQAYIAAEMAVDALKFGRPIKTGFPLLDEKTAGGLYPGLYVVAAASSLGKSTFCYQIAEQIAAAGTDVLYFALEMSRFEMVSKSFARRVAVKRGVFSGSGCLTGTQIRSGRHMTKEVLTASRELIEEVGDRLSVIEGNFKMTAQGVEDYVQRFTKLNGKPVVFIDYLQNLMPTEQRQTTKEIMDNATRSLKLLSRELSIPIIAISSINRVNYLTPICFEAIKESGGIEYTADTIFGLEFACLNEDVFDKRDAIKEKRERIDEAKAETPRKIRLKILKCRNAKAGESLLYDYFPACDYFREQETVNLADKYDKPTRNGRRAK